MEIRELTPTTTELVGATTPDVPADIWIRMEELSDGRFVLVGSKQEKPLWGDGLIVPTEDAALDVIAGVQAFLTA